MAMRGEWAEAPDASPSPTRSPLHDVRSSPDVVRPVVMRPVCFRHSLRKVVDLRLERGMDIRHDVRPWWSRFGSLGVADIRRHRLNRMRGFRHWQWRLVDVRVKINGGMHDPRRAADHESEALDSDVTWTRDKENASPASVVPAA